jgi:hypothetical protein
MILIDKTIGTCGKSEKIICLGIFDKDLKKIAKFVNTILLSTNYFIWKERNVVKY